MTYHIVCSSNAVATIKRFVFKGQDEGVRFYIYDYVPTTHGAGALLEQAIMGQCAHGDLIISFDNFHVFSRAFLESLPCQAINFHPSALPAYGGINPISWGLWHKAAQWGTSWHIIAAKIDAGPIIRQTCFDMPQDIYQIDLLSFCMMNGLKDLRKILASGVANLKAHLVPPAFAPSYYGGGDQPRLNIQTWQDAARLERVQPISPKQAWRWHMDVAGIACTLISRTPSFKGKITLSKSTLLEGKVLYYAD